MDRIQEGKLKTIPIERVYNGMKVIIYGNDKWHILTIVNRDNFCNENVQMIVEQALDCIEELKTIAVEFPLEDGFLKYIPFEYKQWEYVLKKGKVDSDKTMKFKLFFGDKPIEPHSKPPFVTMNGQQREVIRLFRLV